MTKNQAQSNRSSQKNSARSQKAWLRDVLIAHREASACVARRIITMLVRANINVGKWTFGEPLYFSLFFSSCLVSSDHIFQLHKPHRSRAMAYGKARDTELDSCSLCERVDRSAVCSS